MHRIVGLERQKSKVAVIEVNPEVSSCAASQPEFSDRIETLYTETNEGGPNNEAESESALSNYKTQNFMDSIFAPKDGG